MGIDSFELKLDLSEVIEAHKDIEKELNAKLRKAAQNLAIQTHAHVKEEAAKKLHTRLAQFNENLEFEKVDNNTWAVVVKQPARWIEDGMEPHSMVEDLLKSPKAKTVKNGPNKGMKYLVVPFKHSKGNTQQTPHARAIKAELKKELKAVGVKYGSIERNPDGSPKTGLIHKFDFRGKQNKPGIGPNGPPMANHSTRAGEEGPEGRPFLHGVRIYQKGKVNADGSPKLGKNGLQMATREIFTFRVVSQRHMGTGKWFHPGTPPMHFLDEAYVWAKTQWESQIEPELLRSMGIIV